MYVFMLVIKLFFIWYFIPKNIILIIFISSLINLVFHYHTISNSKIVFVM